MMTVLYRHFAADKSLLYVGISLHWPSRTKTHSRNAAWFEQVSHITMEWFDTREAALEAEKVAIKTERPKYNVIHNRETTAAPTYKAPVLRRLHPNDVGGRFRHIFRAITGPYAMIGPALIYPENQVAAILVHGEKGKPAISDMIVFGELAPSAGIPWAGFHCNILELRRSNDVSLSDARLMRADLIAALRANLRSIQTFDCELELAFAHARDFPCPVARRLVGSIIAERAAA